MSLADLGFGLASYAIFGSLLVGFAFITTIYLYNRSMSYYGLLSFLFMTFLILSSIVNIENSDLKNGIYMAFEIWMFQMLCYYYRHRIHIIIISAAIIFSFCVYANLIHMLLNPVLWIVEKEKDNEGYLLGYNYNGMGFRFIVALVLSIMCMKYSKRWLFNVIPLAICSIIPLVITGSKTSLSSIGLFLAVCCIPSVKIKKIAAYSTLVFVILFQTFVVFNGKGLENNEMAVYIIEDILEKDITFSYRTYLWDMSLDKIAESPIWGYGNLDYTWFASYINTTAGTGPCNMVLCILLNGGIILLALYLLIFIVSVRKVSIFNDQNSAVILMGLVVIMLMHLMESLSYVFCFYLMTLAYYYPYITSESLSEHDSDITTNN